MNRCRPFPVWIPLAAILVGAVPVGAQDQDQGAADGSAVADSLAAAAADSLEGNPLIQALQRKQLERAARSGTDDAEDLGLLFDFTNAPEAGVKANVTRIKYFGKLNNSVNTAGGGRINDVLTYDYDTYRRQDRTVEGRTGLVNFTSGEGAEPYAMLPVLLRLEASTNWQEDITVNSAGSRNERRDERRRAGVTASRANVMTGRLRNSLQAGWYYNDANGVNLGQISESNETELVGALRTGVPIIDGVALATRVYRTKRNGENTLSGFTSPSETIGDTLGIGAYYLRGPISGRIVATQADFNRTYVDYRRDANGLIDTTSLPEGVSKIVEELEEKDALKLDWDTALKVRRLTLDAKISHKFDKQQYRQSSVGHKERNKDDLSLRLSFPVGRDSLAFAYKYGWNWDDQRLKDAQQFRGRQYKKARELSMDWYRQLFRHTKISGRYRVELAQEIAQFEFNQNDRDRYTEEARLKLVSSWTRRFTSTLIAEYFKKDDFAIRATRSANNNTKRTYEVSPQYRLHVSDKVSFQQQFRMFIQFQDYIYDGLDSVRKEDTFNKRGIVSSKVTYKPTGRLEVIVEHDYNTKYNGTREATDAAGRSTYRRDQDQVINRAELSFNWKMTDWMKLQSATYRTRDEVERFGTTSRTTLNRSGELWVGATFDKSWGPRTSPFKVKGRVKRNLAYGPNVTDTSDDYWEADMLVNWTF